MADRVVAQTILLALAVSGVLAGVGWVGRHELLDLIGAEGAVLTGSLACIEIIFLALPLTVVFRVPLLATGRRRHEDSHVAGVHLRGHERYNRPVFILGWGPFPAMGTRGAESVYEVTADSITTPRSAHRSSGVSRVVDVLSSKRQLFDIFLYSCMLQPY
jgi:hypothetical protein